MLSSEWQVRAANSNYWSVERKTAKWFHNSLIVYSLFFRQRGQNVAGSNSLNLRIFWFTLSFMTLSKDFLCWLEKKEKRIWRRHTRPWEILMSILKIFYIPNDQKHLQKIISGRSPNLFVSRYCTHGRYQTAKGYSYKSIMWESLF